ncbi:hypothetical protein [Motiliproteus sp. SC1-56]|uniref:hypothetical protein n=1 Tax=Motiliproteus sp. SC1-56 TaxID=2799565 RepID=UPI001A8FBC92|nr:hypothetical protein [Motiliproteus sp. SC1-56]
MAAPYDHERADAREGEQAAGPELPLGKTVAEYFQSNRRYIAELLNLLTLEVRYSGLMLGSVIALALIAALALFSLWALANAALLLWLVTQAWAWPFALLLGAGLNLLLLLAALWQIRRALARMGVDATRQALGLGGHNASKQSTD